MTFKNKASRSANPKLVVYLSRVSFKCTIIHTPSLALQVPHTTVTVARSNCLDCFLPFYFILFIYLISYLKKRHHLMIYAYGYFPEMSSIYNCLFPVFALNYKIPINLIGITTFIPNDANMS